MTVNDVSGKAIANLGWKEIKLTAPVFCGDTLYAESEVLEKRESKLRPTQQCILSSDGIRSQGIDLEAGPRRGRQALKNGIH